MQREPAFANLFIYNKFVLACDFFILLGKLEQLQREGNKEREKENEGD